MTGNWFSVGEMFPKLCIYTTSLNMVSMLLKVNQRRENKLMFFPEKCFRPNTVSDPNLIICGLRFDFFIMRSLNSFAKWKA